MATEGPGKAPAAPSLTSLPKLEDIPVVADGGYEPGGVREAFESFRRHAAQLQAQLRVLQAAGRGASVEPTGHAVRMDALHLVRAAAEFADTLERDAQSASAAQLGRTEEEVSRRQREIQEKEAELERYKQETERGRADIMSAAKAEARDLLANSNRDASQELREAEARAARLLEQARHQATDLTNAARAEVEQTLEWARAQAAAVMARAQQGAEQFIAAAGLGEPELSRVVEAIVKTAERDIEIASTPPQPSRPAAALAGMSAPPPAPPVSAPTEPPVTAPADAPGKPGSPSFTPPPPPPSAKPAAPAPAEADADAPSDSADEPDDSL